VEEGLAQRLAQQGVAPMHHTARRAVFAMCYSAAAWFTHSERKQ